jgi:hypothetical protein
MTFFNCDKCSYIAFFGPLCTNNSATKKKVTGWYNQFKTQRAEAAARNQANQQHQGQYYDAGSSQGEHQSNQQREPIRFGSRTEEDEPLGKGIGSHYMRNKEEGGGIASSWHCECS